MPSTKPVTTKMEILNDRLLFLMHALQVTPALRQVHTAIAARAGAGEFAGRNRLA